MLREMRTLDDHSKSLESYFEAFTFTGGSLMVIEAEVETCLDKCKPVSVMINANCSRRLTNRLLLISPGGVQSGHRS